MPKIHLALVTTVIDNREGRGTALVARELLARLLRHTDEFEFTLIHHESSDDPIYATHTTLLIPHLPRPFDRQLFRELWFWFRLRSQGKRFDIVHYLQPRIWPSYLLTASKKVVFTAHEAGVMLDLHPHGLGDRFFQFTNRFLNSRMDRVIAVSEYAANEIVQYFHIPKRRTAVVYNALPDGFAAPEKTAAVVVSKYKLPTTYLLSVGRLDPHKNILRLIDAYAIARASGVTESLVLVGGKHLPRYSKLVEERIHSLELEEYVYIAPYISEADLPSVYEKAKALIYPSLHEGFGMPLLEAMAVGTPITASNTTSLPEIAGDAAFLFDPVDTKAMSEAIVRILSDRGLRASLTANGLRRVADFSWTQSTESLLEIYRAFY